MTTEQKVIKNKLGLLNLAQMLGNVSEACRSGSNARRMRIPLGPSEPGLNSLRFFNSAPREVSTSGHPSRGPFDSSTSIAAVTKSAVP